MPAPDRIGLDITVDAPIAIVWRILTSPEHITAWYAFDGAEVDLRPGGEITFHWDEHGTYRARIVRLEPPAKLWFRYASLSPDTDPGQGNATLVAFSLEENASGTNVSLVETGYSDLNGRGEEISQHAAEGEMAWRNALDLLRDRVLHVTQSA
jgi:uncharacterized protein YndB with AHSA1/START domain